MIGIAVGTNDDAQFSLHRQVIIEQRRQGGFPNPPIYQRCIIVPLVKEAVADSNWKCDKFTSRHSVDFLLNAKFVSLDRWQSSATVAVLIAVASHPHVDGEPAAAMVLGAGHTRA